MKTRIILTLALLTTAIVVNAQETPLKIGYTNAEYILSFMPEAKQIESELKAYEGQLQNQLQAKVKDFETKYRDFEQNQESMLPAIREDKQRELQNLNQSIEQFRSTAQVEMQKKQSTLLEPVFTKIQDAIDAVAKENGYTHVFNSGQPEVGLNILLYARDEDNISDLIFKKLGIEPPKEGEAGTN